MTELEKTTKCKDKKNTIKDGIMKNIEQKVEIS